MVLMATLMLNIAIKKKTHGRCLTLNSINKLHGFGSPLDSDLASNFMCSFKNELFKGYLWPSKFVFSSRYVYDILSLFCTLDHTGTFQGYLSSKYPNVNFSFVKA